MQWTGVLKLLLFMSYVHGSASQQMSCPGGGSALGMKDGRITDQQLSASSIYRADSTPQMARLNNTASGYRGAWVPRWDHSYANEYLMIDMLVPHIITGIAVQNGGAYWINYWMKEFEIMYGNDNLSWRKYQRVEGEDMVFAGISSHARDDIVTYTLDRPFSARYIVVSATSWQNAPALRMELYGCHDPNPSSATYTLVQADIVTPSTWSPSQGPFILNRPITVTANGQLTIQAGVDVILNSTSAGFFVQGCFRTEGLQGFEVRFMSSDKSSALGRRGNFWTGIKIQMQTCDVIDLSHTLIQGAEIGLNLLTSGAVLNMDHVFVRHCSSVGVRLASVNLTMNYSEASNCGGDGVEYNGNGNISVTGSRFTENYNQGFYFYRTSGSTNRITFDKCYFRSTRNRLLYLYQMVSTVIQIENSTFISGYSSGLEISTSSDYYNGANISVTNSSFSGRSNTLYVYDRFRSSITPNTYVVAGNVFNGAVHLEWQNYRNPNQKLTFHNNTLNSSTSNPLYIYRVRGQANFTSNRFYNNGYRSLIILRDEAPPLTIRDNVFLQNSGPSVLEVARITGDAFLGHIERNVFRNNSATVTLELSGKANATVNENTFENFAANREVQIAKSWNRTQSMDMRYNYWGTADPHNISARVDDFYINNRKAVAKLSPYLSTDNATKANGPFGTIERQYNSTESDGIGGVLIGDTSIAPVTLPNGTAVPINVRYTIYVPQGASLTIDPGVSLKFLENRGIVVDGVLNINGIASDMVKLTPVLYQSPWGGIVFTELTGPEPITTTTPTKTTSATTHKTGWSTSTETPCEGYPEVPCGDNTDYAVRRKRMAEANSIGMSTLNYMNISRGSTCVEVLGGRGLVLLNSRLDSCTQAGISITTGSADQTIVIKNTTLMNMPSRKGMVIGANSDSGATILDVQGSKFLSNSFISISCSECHISFENSTFFGNTILLLLTQIYSSSRKDLEYRFVGNHFETTAWSTSHIMHVNVERATDNSQVKFINNTVISNNRYNTIYFEKERYTDPFYNISGNYFTSPRGVSMRFYLEGLTNGSVKGNYFNNTAGAIQLQGSCCYSSPKLFEITENVFADTTNGGTLIDLNTYFVRNREVVVKENTFVNNTVSQYIITMRSIDVNITGNFFDNPGSTYDLGITFSYNENDAANAKNNWWGGPGFSHVIGRIFDYEDNPSRGRVEFQPYLNARNLSALSDLEPPFVIGPGRIGGTVKGGEILTAADSPYEVVRDILVPETSTLTIEPGTSILFHPGIGMDVKGELMSTGAPDNPVKMTGLDGGSWKGITFEQYLPDPYLRAANGSGPHEGRLEVFFNNTWQLVCGTYGWDMRAAQVACRQLGYGEALEFFKTETVSRFTRGKLREYHMTSMNCNGDEHFLQECSIAVNIRYCSDSNLASVVCNQSATIPTNRSSLVHTVVSNTTRGVSVRGSPPSFKGIEITNSSQNGLTFSGYIPEETAISDCIIANSGADGVSFTGVSDSRQNHGISIRNCTISNNAKRGAYIYRTDIALSNSSIHDNGEQGVYERRVLNTEIQNVDFVRNKQGAVYFTDTRDLETLIIHDNSFKNNSGSVMYIEIPSNSRPNVSIARNVFTWNDGQPRGLSYYGTYGVIDLRFYFYTQNITGSYSIMKNSMENNLAEFVVRLWSNARDNYGVGEDISIIDNIFKNTSRRIYYREVNSVTLENVYNVSINRNVFSNPLATREFVAPKYKPMEYIDVSENCWDVSEAVDVYKRVLSIYEDTTRADVQLWPIFLNGTCGDVAPTQRPVGWGFSDIQDSGGEVDSLTDLGTVQGTVILGRSVVIRPKGVLSATIGSNLTLRFKPGRGLIVAGQMLLDNPRGSPVVFTSDSPTSSWSSSGRWNGIIFEPEDGQHSLSLATISQATTCLTIRRANLTVGSVVVTDCSGVGISSALNDRASFVKIFNSTVNATRSQGIRMTGKGDLNLDNVLVKDTGSHAIEYSAAGDLIVTNSVVNKSSSYGIIRSSQNGGVKIMNSQITEISRPGIQLSAYYMDYVNIEGNYIARTSNYYDWALALYSISYPVTVKNNTIESNTGGGMVVSLSSYSDISSTIISDNIFRDNRKGGLWLQNVCQRDVLVNNNRFENHDLLSETVLKITAYQYTSQAKNITVRGNELIDNSGQFILQIQNQLASKCTILVEGNFLKDNRVSESIVVTETGKPRINYNIFSNPISAYDLRAFYTDDEILDARHNWWGSSDHNQVKSRIQDREVSANYGNVSYVPFLLSPEFSCNNVNNCSGNGVCIRPDTCECNIGRKGADCSQASCAQVFECQGRGTCVGPNTCQCDSGWMPPDCVRATCEGRNNCSKHGLCIEPNRCRCFTRYQGENCSECSGNHWGPECRPCQPCVHGSCDQQTGSCVCSGPNWTGDQCNRCSPKFYGPACLPLMRVLSVAPDGGPDIGGTVVRVTGHNFPNSTEYSCRFGSVEIPGTWISTEEVTCKAPKQNPNTVRIAIRSQNDGSFSTELVFFTYYGICPASACGRLYQPPRGICSFGECLCSKPWSGDNCTVLRLAPKIANIPNLLVTEGESVEIPLSLTEGSTPVEWRLLGSPSGMALDSGSQIIRWDSAVASPAPYTVGVSAQNDIGSDRRQFNLTVRRSYEAELDPVNYGPFISATPTLLTGRVNFIESSPFRNSPVPVKVVVVSQTSGSRRVLSATTFAHSNTFFVRFYPSSSEAGIYVAGASHPKDPQDYNQTRWSFLGMTVSPRYLRVGGYLGFYSYNESMKVTNHGGDRLHNVTVQIPEFVTGIVTLKPTGEGVCTSFPCSLKRVFQPGEEISLDLDFSVTQSASGYFEVAFVSGEQVYASGQVNYNFQPKMPTLTLTPSSIRTSISRGKTRLFEVNVTNSGLATAHNIYVDLGSVDILSVASFSKKGDPSTEDIKFHLDQGESATLVLSALIQQDASLGQTVGNILVRSDEVGSSINFRITTTSTRLVDIYVLVEDEYTYFGTNRSYLANATVHLRNKLENIRLTAKSNASGIAVFKDVAESFYDVYAEAEKHTPLSKVIAANEDQNLVRMFLERTGVTYNWRVEPVTFEDRYVITLEADFETQVPMPVVTIDPKELDLDVLERCAYGNSITFTVTNHGLVRADDFQFTLPDANAHPFLRFAMAQDGPIGDIAANTSVQFSVLVYGCGVQADEATGLAPVVARQRRAFGGTVCSSGFSFSGSYSYICDTKRTRSFSVPARPRTARPACISIIINPPRGGGGPDGGPGGPGGGPSGGGCCAGSSSLTVTVTQDVSCEKCVLNVVDCILGNVPPFPFSCGYTIGTKARPGALGNGGAVGWAKDVADVVFACVPALSVLSSIWGGLRCIETIGDACLPSVSYERRRRAISLLTKEEVAPILAYRVQSLQNLVQLMLMFVDEPEQWQFVDANVWWKNQLRPLLADDSDGGHLITRAELDSVRGTNPTNMSEVMMENFVTRLNNSLTNWENGILEGQGVISYNKALERMNRITNDTRTAKDAGAQTIFDWHNEANQQFLDAKTGRGVCAKVRIQIVQELVLTRDAFEATLEIENGETNTLEKIRVEIIITRSETGERATELFSIGQPKLSGLTDVSGNGTLTPKQEGSSIWLIVPYSEAAPQEDTQYDMGGKLFYTLNGEEITVPLFPDTVTVKPDPRLHINYFLEKYVLGDDPFTTDVVEPSVPFSLGVLVSNTGYGSANQMQITSAQPEIIDNEKGLLISFKITGAQLGAEPISTSLTVNFGDILPNTTKMARWMMTSSLPGRFSNYSATFENINPLGDPQLSVLDSVEFHELLHVVRVEPDDGIPDFLVVPDMSLDLLPNFIYTSHDGNNPYPVSSANITHVQFNGGKEIKLTVKSDSSGWIYARTEFSEDLSLDVDSVTRSDGKTILPDYNMWIGKINDNSLLQIVDFYENTTGVHMYMYTVKLARKNIFAPKFDPTYISLNVTEGTPTDTLIYTAMATDNDTPPENMVSYHLQSTGSVPFSVNDQSGEIRVSGDLDREMEDIISFRILATDGGEPQKTGTLSVDAHVIDVNDEYPVFNPTQYSTNLEVDAPVSYSIVQVSATDRDSGSNGQLTYGINNPDGTFEIDPDTGELRVASSLNTSLSPYVLEIFAEDRGIPPRRSPVLAQVTIKVTPVNRNAPVFDADVNSFSIAEAAIIGTVVGSVSASDHDTSQTVTYMLGPNQNIPFEVNTTSGALRTTGVLDYEKAKLYEFTVLAKDNGNPPTGSLTGTTTVSVNVTDVNDNAAAFADNAYDVTILEDSEMGTNVIRTVAFDADSGENGRISIVTLIGSDLPFEVNFDGSNVTVRTAGLLDRETKDSYVFNLVAVDAGVPQKTGLAQVTVTVEDVNDNPPVITPPADPVTLAPDTPVNTEVTTVQATDADITGMLRYSLSNDGSGKFAINAETGAIRLIKPLAAAQTSFTVDVLVTDGVHNVTASVNLQVATSNTFAPFFNKTKYETMVLENSAPGVVVETVVATDQDSSVVTYSIADGNVGSAFTIDAVSGQITVQGSLDRESRPMYNLTVVASDSGINGQNILTSAVPVFITVGDVNEFTPEFQETELVSRIYENLPGNTFLREFKVQDNDTDQTIHFTLIQSAENAFFISSDGQIYITKSLDREMTGLYRMAVVAKDDGVPPRSSTMDLEVQVLDVNDNAPVFTAPSYNETVNLADLPDGSDAILTVKAVDADIDANGVVRYGLESSPNDYFEIDSIMGVIRILPAGRNVVGERTETLTVVATDRGTPPQTSAAVARITLIGAETPRTNYSIEVSEDTLPGSTILHLNVTQVGLSVVYTIVDGNAEGKFSVEVHGHLVLESRLDRETTPSYVLTLNGTDGQFTVHITVTRSTSSTSTTTSTTTPTTTTTTETLTTTTETSTTTTTETSTTTSSETESTTTVLTPSTTTPTIQQLNEELTAKRREVFDVMEQLKDAALPTQDFMRMFNQWRIMIFEYLQVYNERQERMNEE